MQMPTRPTGSASLLTAAASLLLIAVGTVVLAGWILDIHALKGLGGAITMKTNAAIGLLTSGLSLRLLLSRRAWAAALGRACAIVAAGLGALTLSEHLVGWNLGIDELLFPEAPGAAATTSPNRMGPNASTSLSLAGIALWHLHRGDSRAIVRAQVIASCITVLALVPIIGYLYGATRLYAVARYTGIALHTGIALLVLGIGILAARPHVGPVSALMGEAAHGVMARRLLLPAIALPLFFGYLALFGERRRWFDSGFGTSVIVVGVIVLLSVTIWRTAVALARSDHARRFVEAARDDLLISERAARERAERADRTKDEFIAALSHELRTPLNAVVGWMHMLQQGVVSDADRRKAIDAVTRNAGALTRLIEDLVDTSRIATGHLELSRAPVNVPGVVQAAVESVAPTAVGKGVTVTVSAERDLPAIMGDAQRLQQVLWNVLSNAVKFSPAGSTVRVEVTADDGSVMVRVHDDGYGIDPGLLPHVFERFRQGDSASTREAGGLGLGLHIAKHLVERHGGAIYADSAGSGAGAVFTIALPVPSEHRPQSQSAAVRSRSPQASNP